MGAEHTIRTPMQASARGTTTAIAVRVRTLLLLSITLLIIACARPVSSEPERSVSSHFDDDDDGDDDDGSADTDGDNDHDDDLEDGDMKDACNAVGGCEPTNPDPMPTAPPPPAQQCGNRPEQHDCTPDELPPQ